METDEVELKTIADLMRERDRLKDLQELLENGDIENALRKIKRDIETITEALETK